MKDLLFVEYSKKQNAFHKHPASQMIKTNHRTLFSGHNSDYIPVGMFETHDQADEWIKNNREKFGKIRN